jgi:tRNA threonylcarbamoyladenosine biosynthesis protein TsaB
VVLVIDTSSARSALALLESPPRPGAGRAGVGVLAEDVFDSGREVDLPRRAAALAAPGRLSAVAVALGPGSFTGLRVGVSYGLGLALGLTLPLLGLGSLEIQASRARTPATGLVEAGRGRVYWLAPGSEQPGQGEPAELPREAPAVGWLRPATAAAVEGAGVRLLTEEELDGFGSAAARLVARAPRLDYGRVALRYMHSFATPG